MTGIDEVTGVLKREDCLVLPGPPGRLIAVGRHDAADIDILVLEKAVGGFGFRPIRSGLVDGAFRRIREAVAQFD